VGSWLHRSGKYEYEEDVRKKAGVPTSRRANPPFHKNEVKGYVNLKKATELGLEGHSKGVEFYCQLKIGPSFFLCIHTVELPLSRYFQYIISKKVEPSVSTPPDFLLLDLSR